MRNATRLKYQEYLSRLASLNDVSVDAVISKFSATPSVQQTLEDRIQESSAFLSSINTYLVDEQEGEKIGLGVTGPIASRTNTTTTDRSPRDVSALDASRYRCEQTNYDTFVRYATLDAWAKFKDFQVRLANAIIQRIALDRIMIGFNGTSAATTTNIGSNPLLQDVNIGWLQKVRTKAPERYMKETVAESGKVTVGGSGDEYKNLDALVYDVVSSMIDPWFRSDTKLVAIVGRKILSDKYFPLVNEPQAPTETLAKDVIISQKRIGNLPAVQVPYFPDNAVLVTRLDNLSIYAQQGTQRRSVRDNPARDRIDTFQSSNDAFELEDYGCAALVDNIEVA